ncbi:MAG: lipid II flippase MurJ [Patescibacteria group bacterium]
MVKGLIRFLHRETTGLHEAAYLLGFFAVLSQILAFLRDRLLAHIFGASSSLDIYYAAFRIPDFIFVTAASVVSISVLVPFIIEKEKSGKDEVKKFIDSVFSYFSVFIIGACAVTFFLIPELSEKLFPGFSPEMLEKVILVSRIMLLSPVALGFSNLLGSLTQAYNRFAIYALAPLLYNVGIILGIVLFGKNIGVVGVAIGVVLGASLHALVQVPFIAKEGLLPNRFRFNFAPIKRVMLLSLPRTLSLSTNQIAIISLVSFASLMAAGSVSVLSFSINLQSVPLTIVGVSYSLAAFPTLSRFFTEGNREAFVEQMAATARHIIFWTLPLTALFVVLRAQIVRVLLGTGRFDWTDTRLTAAALAIFVVSSVFQCLLLAFMRAFYAAGHTKKPFYINFFSAIFLILSTYLLIKVFYWSPGFQYFFTELLKVGGLAGAVVLMLPLGYSLGTIINGLAHWYSFEKEFGNFTRKISRTIFESFGTSVIMGAAAYIGLVLFAPVFNTSSLIGIFLQGFVAGALAIFVGIAILYALGSKELSETWKAIHRKFWKAEVVASDPEIV